MDNKYHQFQKWLNQCPVQIEDFQDHTDHAIVMFNLPLEPEDADLDEYYEHNEKLRELERGQ